MSDEQSVLPRTFNLKTPTATFTQAGWVRRGIVWKFVPAITCCIFGRFIILSARLVKLTF